MERMETPMDKKDIIAKMNAYAAHTMVKKLGIEINTSHLRPVSDGWAYGKVTLANWKKHPGLGYSNYG